MIELRICEGMDYSHRQKHENTVLGTFVLLFHLRYAWGEGEAMKKSLLATLLVVSAVAGLSAFARIAQMQERGQETASVRDPYAVSGFKYADIWLCEKFLLPRDIPQPEIKIAKYIAWHKGYSSIGVPQWQLKSHPPYDAFPASREASKNVKADCFINDLFFPRTVLARDSQAKSPDT